MSDLNLERCEMYPGSWQHAVVHRNPFTDELHFDGDVGIREFVRYKIKRLDFLERERVEANKMLSVSLITSILLAITVITMLILMTV
jgi:hypothetical protein